MSDAKIEKLGRYFVYHDILDRFGITFERFVYLVENNMWEEYVA